MKKIFIAILSMISIGLQAQETMHPSPAQTKKIVITGATIHVGNGQVIEKGNLIIEKGKLKIETSNPSLGSDVEHIDATGKHIYPGIIAPNTNLGLVEVSSTRATVDYLELGDIHPNVRSLVAYNTDSKVINTLRTNGVLLAQIVPQGGLISGSSSVVQLDAWNWEDAAYLVDEGIHMTMPALINRPNNMRRGNAASGDPVRAGLARIEQAKGFFREAKAYLNEKSHAEVNLKFEAVKGLFNRSQSLYIHCDLVKEMLAAIELNKEFNFKMVIAGGADSWMIADILKENQVSVILSEPHSLPATEDDAVDQPYKTGAMLYKAGVLVSISQDSGDGYTQQRNLPFMAGTLAAYGLSKEEALQVITSNPAKILGIEKRTGTIENGKDANILICQGDLLDMKSSVLTHAFIQGRAIDLQNKHTQLFERYKYKYQIK
ncbi:amidohydrolase family protein [Aquirufa ecclesiirivi]|uniref:Amidohydrolase family protein n=1 Tax=Aquirufa ecclesiirivi TaxID=2715124 RepID=A0ABT4JFT9_9BACT|nr:amidohydrolase family protein [Aquirufa ecclesiirivi]MCZ2475146.1 amidohydrolase family protein [Aquirufa ecclesiirivi]MDF0692437.1 amidohydrolase family protein [Aquirufa ecclesiirivi]